MSRGDHTDSRGNAVSAEEFYVLFSEGILANVIAFEEAGVPRGELEHSVDHEGGTIIGREMQIRTLSKRRLSEEDGRLFVRTYLKLIEDYLAGRLDPDRLDRLRNRDDVPKKASIIRARLRKSG